MAADQEPGTAARLARSCRLRGKWSNRRDPKGGQGSRRVRRSARRFGDRPGAVHRRARDLGLGSQAATRRRSGHGSAGRQDPARRHPRRAGRADARAGRPLVPGAVGDGRLEFGLDRDRGACRGARVTAARVARRLPARTSNRAARPMPHSSRRLRSTSISTRDVHPTWPTTSCASSGSPAPGCSAELSDANTSRRAAKALDAAEKLDGQQLAARWETAASQINAP